MIRILELESSLGFGGQEHRTQRVINGLDESKFKVFYGLNQGSKSLERPIKCEFVEFNLKKIYNIFEIFKICRFVRQNKIDIISTHSGKDGNIGMIVGRLTGAKVVRTRHLQTPIGSALSYNLSNRVVAVSNATKQGLISRGVKENLIEIIYTGVDTKKFNPAPKKDIKSELNLAQDCVVIGIVAVLREAKNHKLLLQAFSELNLADSALVIVGDGPQEANLKELSKGMKNVFMTGARSDVSEILPSFDIFILPSKMEALGTALLEASACAVPCIGSDAGGISEAVLHEKTGLIFKSDDKESLKNAIKILASDKELRKRLGANAREHVELNFSIEKMVEDTQKLYENL